MEIKLSNIDGIANITTHDLDTLAKRIYHSTNKIKNRKEIPLAAKENEPLSAQDRYNFCHNIFAGMYRDNAMVYPHGLVHRQGSSGWIFRGENKLYESSVATLLRNDKVLEDIEGERVRQLIADMRVAEFAYMIANFGHVQRWHKNIGHINFEALAQHYGFETRMLDVTSDLMTALFFATTYYDGEKYSPLTKEMIQKEHSYGVVFACEIKIDTNLFDLENLVPFVGDDIFASLNSRVYRNINEAAILPIGYQPFMRTSNQFGHCVYMNKALPLQDDHRFKQLIFKQDEKFSRKIFYTLKKGKKVFPEEGINLLENNTIRDIKETLSFSKDAFLCAKGRSAYYRDVESKSIIERLKSIYNIKIVDGHGWYIDSKLKSVINNLYDDYEYSKVPTDEVTRLMYIP